jgi:hypothetical protein
VKQEPAEYDYVLNMNTMKFHYPWCKSVKKIKPENIGYTSLSHEALVSMGYSPCGNCH